MAIGFDGVIIAVEVSVSDPEVDPGPGILRIDAQGLAKGLDGVIVALEVAVSDPEVDPGVGILRIDAQGLAIGSMASL